MRLLALGPEPMSQELLELALHPLDQELLLANQAMRLGEVVGEWRFRDGAHIYMIRQCEAKRGRDLLQFVARDQATGRTYRARRRVAARSMPPNNAASSAALNSTRAASAAGQL